MKKLYLKYHFTEATVPPPDYFEYLIVIDGLECHYIFQPDYSINKPPFWIERFLIDEKIQSLLINKIKMLSQHTREINNNMPVGDSLEWIEIIIDNEKLNISSEVEKTNALTEFYSFINQLVTQEIKQTIEEKYQTYKKNFDAE